MQFLILLDVFISGPNLWHLAETISKIARKLYIMDLAFAVRFDIAKNVVYSDLMVPLQENNAEVIFCLFIYFFMFLTFEITTSLTCN